MWQFVLTVCWIWFYPTEGENITQVGCDGSNLSIQCSTGTMTVMSVTWGRQDYTTCPGIYPIGSEHLNNNTCFCSVSSPVDIVMSSCNEKSSCSISAYGPTMCSIDPCFGIYKYLSVTYSCSGSATITSAPQIPAAPFPTNSHPVAAVTQVAHQQVQSQSAAPVIPIKATRPQSVFEKNPWLMWFLIGTTLVGIFALCCGLRPYLVAKRNKKKMGEIKEGKKVENEGMPDAPKLSN